MAALDIKATQSAVRRCVEEYGSITHLADALGIGADVLRGWMEGDGLPSAEQYGAMLDLAAHRGGGAGRP